MKNFMAVVAVAVAIIFSVPAMAEESTLSGTAEIGASMKNVDELSGLSIYDDPTSRMYFEFDHKTGLYAAVEIYENLSVGSYDKPSFYAGLSKDLVTWNWEVGYAYYLEYEMHGLYFSIDLPKPGSWNITPFLNIEADFPNSTEAGDGGVLYRAGLKTAIEIFEQSIFLEASIGGHDGAWDTRPELVSSARVAVSTYIPLAEEKADLVPEVSYQKCLGYKPEDGGMTDNEFFAGAKVVFYF